MNPRPLDPAAAPERRHQILAAAMICFGRKGLHQTTMQDISEQAGISVGLIYRYFESKDQVIATMAHEHLDAMQHKLAEARAATCLTDALEHVLWCDHDADVAAAFVVDLHAEAARNPEVRALVTRVHEAALQGVGDLIAGSPDAARLPPGVTAAQAARMVFQALHGRLFDEIVAGPGRSVSDINADRVATLRAIMALLFPACGSSAAGPGVSDAP